MPWVLFCLFCSVLRLNSFTKRRTWPTFIGLHKRLINVKCMRLLQFPVSWKIAHTIHNIPYCELTTLNLTGLFSFLDHAWCYDDHCGMYLIHIRWKFLYNAVRTGFGLVLSSRSSAHKPALWPLLPHSHCDGKRQSPISIDTKTTVTDEHLDDFTFTKFGYKHAITHIVNTGHTGLNVLLQSMVFIFCRFVLTVK